MRELKKGKRAIFQRRNVYGHLSNELTFYGIPINFRSVFKDLFGLDSTGLERLVMSFGIKFEKNKQLDPYKKNISKAIMAPRNSWGHKHFYFMV